MIKIPHDFTNFDILGDIHGHANDLKDLLTALGYTIVNGVYQHATRKVLFVGDYIDRGKNVVEVLAIVKGMVDTGNAIALMGNHEYNAICYNTQNSKGDYHRPHNNVHTHQHQATLDAFKTEPQLYKMYIEWFKTLPLFYEGHGFRAVHACWDPEQIHYLKERLTNNCITVDLLEEANCEGTQLNIAIEETLKGKELELPNGLYFADKDGHRRTSIRIKWWVKPQQETYKSISVLPIDVLPNINIEHNSHSFHYLESHIPVFFGHYWLPFKTDALPAVLTHNVCCLDYSVAKSGKLVCYRYTGELQLQSDQLYFIA